MYVEGKETDRIRASKVTDIINNWYGSNINRRIVARWVFITKIGESPSKIGLDEWIPKEQLSTFVDVFEAYIEIKQLNCNIKLLSKKH